MGTPSLTCGRFPDRPAGLKVGVQDRVTLRFHSGHRHPISLEVEEIHLVHHPIVIEAAETVHLTYDVEPWVLSPLGAYQMDS